MAIEAGESCELARRMTDSLSVERPVRVQERSDLALELADRPASVKTFRFVKGPFERIVDTDQFDEMRPGEP